MRRAIGICFACLVTSACAIAETPEENVTQSTGVAPENAETPTDRSQSFTCAAAREHWAPDHGSEWVVQHRRNQGSFDGTYRGRQGGRFSRRLQLKGHATGLKRSDNRSY
jgi:hypothetical protein